MARRSSRAAGGTPDAKRVVAEEGLGQLDHDREHVEAGEGVDARVVEAAGLAAHHAVELHQVEEERVVPYAGEDLDPVPAGDDRVGSVAHPDRGRLRALGYAV